MVRAVKNGRSPSVGEPCRRWRHGPWPRPAVQRSGGSRPAAWGRRDRWTWHDHVPVTTRAAPVLLRPKGRHLGVAGAEPCQPDRRSRLHLRPGRADRGSAYQGRRRVRAGHRVYARKRHPLIDVAERYDDEPLRAFTPHRPPGEAAGPGSRDLAPVPRPPPSAALMRNE